MLGSKERLFDEKRGSLWEAIIGVVAVFVVILLIFLSKPTRVDPSNDWVSKVGVTIIKQSFDGNTVWYQDNGGALYEETYGKEAVKIADHIKTAKVYDSGEIYFTRYRDAKLVLKDYVIDDKKEADERMTEPVKPILSEFIKQYGNNQAASDAYNQAYAQYTLELDEWAKKQERDEIRQGLNATWDQEYYELYYYDGTKETLIDPNFAAGTIGYGEDVSIAVYKSYAMPEGKLILSQMRYAFEAEDFALTNYGNYKLCVAVRGAVTDLQASDLNKVKISLDGKRIYALCDVSRGSDRGNLYEITVSDEEVVTAKQIATEAYVDGFYVMRNGGAVYVTSGGDNFLDLYINGSKVEVGVYPFNVEYNEQLDAVLYKIKQTTSSYTLKQYRNNQTTVVGENVSNHIVTQKGELIYLNLKQELYLYRGEESILMEEGVEEIPDSL